LRTGTKASGRIMSIDAMTPRSRAVALPLVATRKPANRGARQVPIGAIVFAIAAALSPSTAVAAFPGGNGRIAHASGGDGSPPKPRLEPDVYLRNLKRGTTDLVSRQSAADGGAIADAGAWLPSISADGRYVAFDSEATNLRALDGDFSDAFVRDTEGRTTELVSRRTDSLSGAPAQGNSYFPAISADGRFVAFSSFADDLSEDDIGPKTADAFLRQVR
jgi:WD40-like Beta Propeller Repeat